MISGPILGGRPLIKWDPTKVKIIADGNSFFANVDYVNKLKVISPFDNKFTITNLGVGGQTWRKMNGLDSGSRADLDNAIDPTKINVVLGCEGTNAVFGWNRTGVQTAGDCADWALATRAVAKAKGARIAIVVQTTIPREGATDAETATKNQELVVFDTLLKANYRSMGIDAVVDVRKGTRFDFVPTTMAEFDALSDLSSETTWVHPNGVGNAIMAACWTPALNKLRIR